MAKKERISDVEISKAEKVNNIIRWTISLVTASGAIGLIFIWLFYQP